MCELTNQVRQDIWGGGLKRNALKQSVSDSIYRCQPFLVATQNRIMNLKMSAIHPQCGSGLASGKWLCKCCGGAALWHFDRKQRWQGDRLARELELQCMSITAGNEERRGKWHNNQTVHGKPHPASALQSTENTKAANRDKNAQNGTQKQVREDNRQGTKSGL